MLRLAAESGVMGRENIGRPKTNRQPGKHSLLAAPTETVVATRRRHGVLHLGNGNSLGRRSGSQSGSPVMSGRPRTGAVYGGTGQCHGFRPNQRGRASTSTARLQLPGTV